MLKCLREMCNVFICHASTAQIKGIQLTRIAGEIFIQSCEPFLVNLLQLRASVVNFGNTCSGGTKFIPDLASTRLSRFGRLHEPIADISPISPSASESFSMFLPFNVRTIGRKDALSRFRRSSFSFGAFVRNGSIDCTNCSESLSVMTNRASDRLPFIPSTNESMPGILSMVVR